MVKDSLCLLPCIAEYVENGLREIVIQDIEFIESCGCAQGNRNALLCCLQVNKVCRVNP